MKTRLRILCLEDEPHDAELARETLASAGFDCDMLRVETREEFEAVLAQADLDLILSDKTLLQYDGRSALALAREKRPAVPFIFVSGTPGEEVAVESLKNGATDYVLKQRLSRLVPVTRRALQKAAERAAREKTEAERKRLSTAVEYAAEAVVITDVAGRIEYVNPAFEQITGYRSAEVIGQNPRILQSGEQDEAFYRVMWDTLTRGQVWQASLVNRKRDGTTYHAEETISPVMDASGHIVNYVAVQHDVTQRVRAEFALRDREQRFRALIENSADAITLVSADGTVLYTSPATVLILGGESEYWLGGNWLNRVHPDDFQFIARSFAQLAQTPGARFSATLRYRHVDGSWRWVEGSGANLLDESAVQAIVLNYRDVTERKHAGEKNLQLATIVESSSDAILSQMLDGTIISWNSAASALFGYTAEEVQGLSVDILIPTDQREEEQKVLEALKHGERGRYIETQRLHEDGTLIPVSVSYSPLADAAGHVSGAATITRDISARRQAEQALDQVTQEDIRENLSTIFREFILILVLTLAVFWVLAFSRVLDFINPVANSFQLHADDFLGFSVVLMLSFGVFSYRRWKAVKAQVIARDKAEETLRNLRADLERRVQERTVDLVKVNESLRGEIAERRRAEESLRQRLAELEAVHSVSAALRAAQTRDEALPILLDETLAALETDAGAIWVYHAEHGELHATVARGWFQPLGKSPMKPGEGIAGSIFDGGQPHISAEFRSDPLARVATRGQLPPNWGGVCLPIRSGALTVGVLFVSVPLPRRITTEQVKLLESLAEMGGAALHRMSLHEETRRQLERLQALHNIDLAITASVDLRMTLTILLEHVKAQLNVDAADVLLLNPSVNTLEYAAGTGFRMRGAQTAQIRLGESFAGRAALERRAVQANDSAQIQENTHFATLWAGEEFAAYYGVPIIAKGTVKGVLEVYRRTPFDREPGWIDFVETLAGQAAIAIDSAQLFDNLQRSNVDLALAYDATIEGWSRALDLRDKETEGHTQRVTEMTERLARAMDIGSAEMVHIHRGALLHDIGKMGVPDSILLKPGPLTDEEWVLMRRHPLYAYELLSPIAFLRPALDIPYCHHEKWDGTGYPRGLKGEQIPLVARVFAVVDVWDALRSDRPYRAAWPEEQIRAHIQLLAGTHFDPLVVTSFLRIV